MTFPDWLASRVQLFDRYRYQLSVITRTVQEYCTDNVCKQNHIELAIMMLRDVDMPVLGKYPGNVTEEDKKYYLNNKPLPPFHWLSIAEAEVKQLLKQNK